MRNCSLAVAAWALVHEYEYISEITGEYELMIQIPHLLHGDLGCINFVVRTRLSPDKKIAEFIQVKIVEKDKIRFVKSLLINCDNTIEDW